MRIEIGLRHLSGADHPGRKMPSHCAVDARAESDIPQIRAIVRGVRMLRTRFTLRVSTSAVKTKRTRNVGVRRLAFVFERV